MAVRQGVFLRARSWPDDPEGRHLIRGRAEQAAHPTAVLSHQTAALEWGLPTPRFGSWADDPVSVTLPRTARGSRTEEVVRHIGALPPGQVQQTRDGYAITSPARTAVDLARSLELPQALVVLDAAARLIVASLVGTQARRRDYANPRLTQAAVELLEDAAATVGAVRVRSFFAVASPLRESMAESLSAGYLELAGLPRPECQVELRVGGTVIYPDFYWPERRLVGEVDGAGKYADPRAFVLEKEREQLLRDLGYRVVRWLAKEIMLHPGTVVDRISRALG